MSEATKTAIVKAVMEADTVKCADMGAAKVATAKTAAVATTSMREGRRWHHEQRSDRKSFKHRELRVVRHPFCWSPLILSSVRSQPRQPQTHNGGREAGSTCTQSAGSTWWKRRAVLLVGQLGDHPASADRPIDQARAVQAMWHA